LNVRAQPSTASETLGILPANTAVQIVGKDPGESWWQILYPGGADGKGWVVAQYVSTAGKPEVPVIGGGGSNPNNGNIAIVQQKINVRSGPGTNFNSIGTLNPQDVVRLTGKDANGAWLQIEFPAGPNGRGWVNAAFVQATGVENLPIMSDTGQLVGTGTPADTPLPPTPTVAPAPMDNDSAQAPLAHVTFDPAGITVTIYNGDVSAPNGDLEDWLAFTPFGGSATIKIECRGNATLDVDILENNQYVRENLTCGEQITLATIPGRTYLLHIQAVSDARQLQYTNYTIRIKANP
jgi:uncharacterized protein YraI